MKKTALGFQALNGESHLTIGDNVNSGIFTVFEIETRILNMENPENKEILQKQLEKENIQDDNIKDSISKGSKEQLIDKLQNKIHDKNLTKDELTEQLQSDLKNEDSKDKRKISKIKTENIALNLIKEFDIDIDKSIITNQVKLRNFVRDEKLMDKKINNYFEDEKRMVMILDNYSVHISYLVRLISKILNIKLIYLPSYSPNLNPIEQVWRTLKGELYDKYIESEEFLANRFRKIYYKIIDRPSFTKKWREKYLQ